MKRTKYSDGFKANALRQLAMPGQTVSALAVELGQPSRDPCMHP